MVGKNKGYTFITNPTDSTQLDMIGLLHATRKNNTAEGSDGAHNGTVLEGNAAISSSASFCSSTYH